MPKILSVLIALLIANISFSQNKTSNISKPKLVVGIVVDQMRWDFLYKFYDLYKPNGGFRRMLDGGFSCDNTYIPYAPTITAPGHASIYTGSVPAINGITGNAWRDSKLDRHVYCVEDKSVKSVGTTTTAGEMSPKNLMTTTITDELRINSNFRSKVIGVAIKDRGAILPAGHAANAAYWYEGAKGNFITSTYYMNDLPQWVKDFNDRKLVDSFYKFDWKIAAKPEVYNKYASGDVKIYEGKPFGQSATGFPYDLQKYIGKDYSKISNTPYGNSLVLEMAKSALTNEKMGTGEATDFLTVSFSSPDYIGHSFGPNSWETLDNYIRLDETLGKLFDHLDATIGKGNYLSFLSADHGVAHIPGYLKENKLPGGTFDDVASIREMNALLKEQFGRDKLVVSMYNYHVHLNHRVIDSFDLDKKAITSHIIKYLENDEAVERVFELDNLQGTTLNSKQKDFLANGFYKNRSGDIQIILKPGYIDGGATGTTHGLWNPYDSHIPLVWYGWKIKPGKLKRETYMTDIAPTIAALLQIQMPNGTVGKVIDELFR